MARIISFKEAFRYWLRLGFISFGGPTGQIAIMHRDVVEKKKWITEDHFLQALNFCMLLPGPEAQQLATYIGWLMHGIKGGIAAGVLFVLPSVFILWGLSWIYVSLGSVPAVAALFYGLKPAVAAIVAEAVIRIGKKALRNEVLISMAALSFIGIYFYQVPFPVIILAAGLIGYAGGKFLPDKFVVTGNNKPLDPAEYIIADLHVSRRGQANWRHSLKVIAVCLPIWFLPLVLLGLWLGWDNIFIDIGMLFSKAAMVTFGGAYAVLAYISQQAVSFYGWILPEQMIDGLGLAETTPGPLIMVTQFVGYLAAYTHAKGIAPAMAGAIGGLLTTWVTFTPCFMWIFVGAPYIERVRENAYLGAALSAITAAVVGVIMNLSVIFTYHVLLPEGKGFDWYALSASVAAFTGMIYFKWGMIPVIVCSAAAGLAWKMYIS
ncbi:MAG: chromate efflux transporter [Nitrospiraceae bacterium]|nr:MAG: chromate efflux transporter [Nitrospiraceae bacterium]